MTAHPSWPVAPIVALLIVAALLMLLASAMQAAIIYVSRTRLHVYASRLGIASEALHRTVRERNKLVGALETTRTVAGVAATAALLALGTRMFGLRALIFLAAAAVAAVAILLLQAVPRLIVKQNPERWGYALTPMARAFIFLLGWLEVALEAGARAIFGLFGLSPPADEDQQQELLQLVELEESTGGIEEEEREMIRGIIGLEDTTVREIMVPRLDVAAVDVEQTLEEAVQIIVNRGFSRIPLYADNIDQVKGIVYAKDLLRALAAETQPASLLELARPAYFIPESKRVDELLGELRRARVHIAIVVDEFGGTAGLVTIEDLLEEIVGEIEDEYDIGEPAIERPDENEAIVDARAGLDVLEDLFDIEIEDPQVDTLGGLVYEKLGRIPQAGDSVQIGDLTITVLAVAGQRLKKLSLVRAQGHAPEAEAAT